MIPAPVSTPAEWGATLRREREAAGRNVASLCDGVSVKQSRWRAFEDGSELPSRPEYHRMCLQLRRMRLFPPPAFPDKREAKPQDEPVPHVEPMPAAPTERPAKTWGEGLIREREREEVTQDEIGQLVGVTGQAVSAWERGVAAPVEEHYEKVCQLFPRLRTLPKPGSRDIPPPDGGRGADRDHVASSPRAPAGLPEPIDLGPPRVTPKVRPPEPPAPPISRPQAVTPEPSTLDRLEALARTLHGADEWRLTFFASPHPNEPARRSWTLTVAQGAKESIYVEAGSNSPEAAALHVLGTMTKEIDARIEKHRADIAALERMKS